jgi:cyclopropane fatty-acyl-phospholipid synthase-like methyltransferase
MGILDIYVSFLKKRNNPEKYRKILLKTGLKENVKILDYGCGIGSYSLIAADITGEHGSVIAVDIKNSMIDFLKREAVKNGIENIHAFKVDSYKDIKEKDYDYILLIDVLHKMDNQIDVVNYFLNCLKNNGKLLVKFEHFSIDRMKSIISFSACSESYNVQEDYWILQ